MTTVRPLAQDSEGLIRRKVETLWQFFQNEGATPQLAADIWVAELPSEVELDIIAAIESTGFKLTDLGGSDAESKYAWVRTRMNRTRSRVPALFGLQPAWLDALDYREADEWRPRNHAETSAIVAANPWMEALDLEELEVLFGLNGGDLSDWDFAAAVEGRYRVHRSADRAARPPLTWTVDGTLPEYGVGQIYGKSYSGKTYAMLDLALSLANDSVETWFGRKINRHGPVVLVLMEGTWDIQPRIDAWLAGHPGCTDERLLTVEEPDLNLSRAEDVRELAERLAPEQPVAVFIDTQALATPGVDENDNTAMSLVFTLLKALSSKLGALVSTVHHCGLANEMRPRGASAQYAACDIAIAVRNHALLAEKVKGGQRWDRPERFRFVPAGDSAYVDQTGISAGAVISAGVDSQDDLRQKVLDALSDGPQSGRRLREKVGAGQARVQTMIRTLEGEGLIKANELGHWALTGCDS